MLTHGVFQLVTCENPYIVGGRRLANVNVLFKLNSSTTK